jgi:hypothetical protein
MKAFLKVFVLLNATGFLTAIVGLTWLDWKITSTLPLMIVSFTLCFQTLTIILNQINFWRTALLVIGSLQLILCNLYFFEILPLYELWKFMISALFVGLIVSSYNMITLPVGWFRWLKSLFMVLSIAGFLLSTLSPAAYTISITAMFFGLMVLILGLFLQSRYSTKVPKP